MLKKFGYLWMGIWIVLLAACTQKIPEGDIKDFVDCISFSRAYEYVNSGRSCVTARYLENDKELGVVSIFTEIDKQQKYYYVNTNASGSYIEEYGFENQAILSYQALDHTISSYKTKNNLKEDITHSIDDLDQFITTFFYTQNDGGYHQGAVYYGDYVILNCAKFYSCFSLNEEKTELTYEVNTSQKNSAGEEIVTMHHFVIDTYGMILSLHTKSIMIERNIVVDTTIECEYNIQIDKKIEL